MNKKKTGRTISSNREKDSPCFFSSELSQEELAKLEEAKGILLPIKEKYKLTFGDLKGLLEEEQSFPAQILNKRLTVLESVVKHLKEEKNLSLSRIAEIIGRDERNLWHVYNRAKKKHHPRIISGKEGFWIPFSIFSNTKLSALEAVVSYLKKEFGLSHHEVALLLKRDDRTIWTVYHRAGKKNAKTK